MREMSLARKVIGVFFLILGVLGLFLPVLQGLLFILIGLALLFPNNHYIQSLLQKAKNRYPRQAQRLDAFKSWLRNILRRDVEKRKMLD
jgi:uncharacterized membrane protein YbaN (DUF454 family)